MIGLAFGFVCLYCFFFLFFFLGQEDCLPLVYESMSLLEHQDHGKYWSYGRQKNKNNHAAFTGRLVVGVGCKVDLAQPWVTPEEGGMRGC